MLNITTANIFDIGRVRNERHNETSLRMKNSDTKLMLAETFVNLVLEGNPDKVFVSDIISRAHKNRKTFYYHFTDKDQLTQWLFRHDLNEILTHSFAPDHLIREHNNEDPCSEFAYYVFIKTGVRSLDGSKFFESLAQVFEVRRDYYRKLFKSQTGSILITYLQKLYTHALEQDILFILSNRRLAQENITFLAEFYAGAALQYLINRTISYSHETLLHDVGPFKNLIHTSLENEIKEQQMRRIF